LKLLVRLSPSIRRDRFRRSQTSEPVEMNLKRIHQLIDMKPHFALFLILVAFTFASCHGTKNIDKRRYTDGFYNDINLDKLSIGKDRKENQKPGISDTAQLRTVKVRRDSVYAACAEAFAFSPEGQDSREDAMRETCPLVSNAMDSVVARAMRKDSINIFTDSLPSAIETAISAQAMLGVATVGALATLAAPELVWFTFLPILLSPVFLLVSLLAAAVAMSKINRGEIDACYKKYMRLWAVMLLCNMAIAAFVITQQTWF